MRIHSIRLTNILSFRDAAVELGDVNVLIGANGSGKTNFIECLRLLRSLADGTLKRRIIAGGGASAWLWRGTAVPSGLTPFGQIGLSFTPDNEPAELEFAFTSQAGAFSVQRESLTAGNRQWLLRMGGQLQVNGEAREDPIPSGDSFFSAYRSPFDTSPVSATATSLEGGIRIFSNFDTAVNSEMREGAPAGNSSQLSEDGWNLALTISELGAYHERLGAFNRLMPRVIEGYRGLRWRLEEGRMRLYLDIEGLTQLLPAERISDGTLRFLCVLAALASAPTGSVLCFEEPETGLHPDAIPLIAEAIDELGADKQVILTTHSPNLVDVYTARPETVIVCERGSQGSHLHRLSSERLRDWLEEYSLGQLWRNGEIGGNP